MTAIKPIKAYDVGMLLLLTMKPFTSYQDLARDMGMSTSTVNGAVSRALASKLVTIQGGAPTVLRSQLLEFLIHGAKYMFPIELSLERTKGLATLAGYFGYPTRFTYVWPCPGGPSTGYAATPLFPSAAWIAQKFPPMRTLLVLVDMLRAGDGPTQGQWTDWAEKELHARIVP